MADKPAKAASADTRPKKAGLQSKVTVETISTAETIDELLARVAKLEKRQTKVSEGFKYAADQLRPIYGMGLFAAVFDAIAEEVAK